MLLVEWCRSCFLDLKADVIARLTSIYLTYFLVKQVSHIQSVYLELLLTHMVTLNYAQLPPAGMRVGMD